VTRLALACVVAIWLAVAWAEVRWPIRPVTPLGVQSMPRLSGL
jgi:hypothetical protein